jgi:hypothetical protein
MSCLSLLDKFGKLSSHQRRLLLEAGFWLLTARLTLLCFRFSRIAGRLGQLYKQAECRDESRKNPAVVHEIAWAIRHAAQAIPAPLVCLPRSLAAWKMLDRRRIHARLHFGASRTPDERRLCTHAWVDACGVEVTGYPEAYRCVEIGYYARE